MKEILMNGLILYGAFQMGKHAITVFVDTSEKYKFNLLISFLGLLVSCVVSFLIIFVFGLIAILMK